MTAIKSTVVYLGLSGFDAANINIKKLPSFMEDLDALPCIVICPSPEPEVVTPFAFEGWWKVDYKVLVILIQAGNLDNSSSSMDALLTARQSIRRALASAPLPNYTDTPTQSVYDVNAVPMEIIDVFKIPQNYLYCCLSIVVSVIEQY